MKKLIICICLLLTAFGCTRSSEQLSGLGKIKSPEGNWKIEMLGQEPGLRITELNGGKVFHPADQWANEKDAFVFVDSEEIIWAFDGIKRVFILEKISDVTYNAYDLAGCQHPVPQEFSRRLPSDLISQDNPL